MISSSVPAKSAVRVYFVPVRELRPDDRETLTSAENERAERFRQEEDRCRFVLARRALRKVLAEQLEMEASAVPLRFGAHGKPELPMNVGPIGFNLSHSGQWILIALADNRRVGVDIEYHREAVDIDAVARGYFTAREAETLRLNPASAARYFFQFWTLKEAYLKATGGGIGAALSGIDVSSIALDSTNRLALPDERGEGRIGVQPLVAPDGYSAAVAADGMEWTFEAAHRWRE